MGYSFVTSDNFTPNLGQWTSIGNIASTSRSGNVFTLNTAQNNLAVQISFLSATCFRVRFNPVANANYNIDNSIAVVNRNLGPVNLNVTANTASLLQIDTGTLQVSINLQPYGIKVYRNGQLINQDQPDYNLVYIPGQSVIANFKIYPANAKYVGFGEKAGGSVLKNNTSLTFFNFDNYTYATGPIQSDGEPAGPKNVNEPLYNSVPLLIENNIGPMGDYQGAPYSYGIFFDNIAQSYFNIGGYGANMYGKYYFGALYGEMDYYFMAGNQCSDVIDQYTSLTGRPAMPPRYVFGYHQGAYGYFDRYRLAIAANSHRAAAIPLDGLHIDVDFQDNYRTFTSSEIKFPNVVEMMGNLHTLGFKCSTNITPLMSNNSLDENGEQTVYAQRAAMIAANALIYNTYAGQGPSPDLFVGQVSYGSNRGSNPYSYPPLTPNQDGVTPLSAYGNYPNLGDANARIAWGQQYSYLIEQLGMDMIWQDMTDPALAQQFAYKTFPLNLMVDDGALGYVPHAVSHNGYVMNLLQATFEGLMTLRPQKRNFIIARGGYAGMQRYAGLWTGDSASSWDFLQINIPEVLNLGISGIPISGCDIGGFAAGSATTSPSYVSYGKVMGGVTNYELLTRWIQVGSFLPWFRNHYDGYNKQFQEVYAYGEPVPTNCRKYIELRYRMNQIYYDAMYESTQSGMPVARALFLNDPNDQAVYSHLDDQFFVGQNILVAPILTPHETASPPSTPIRSVYLPADSNWYAFMDNQYPLQAAVSGGTTINNYYAGLDLVPVYIRAGAILPMRELEQYIGQLPQNPLTFNVYPGPDSQYLLYLDDGISTAAANQQAYRTVQISHQGISGGQNVRILRLHDQYTPAEPFYYVALLGTQQPSAVTAAGVGLQNLGNPQTLAQSPMNAYYWNSSLAITFVKVFDVSSDTTVTALYN
ncbi:MAG: glycoside hydrolase family 31 protein [Methylovulum sp.]|nr:glycoside hydrolase family 31 protein [Methylovulum sp.]